LARVWVKYFSQTKGLKEYQRKIKTTKYLLSRGFEYEDILNLNNAED
jgi:regulatory protein